MIPPAPDTDQGIPVIRWLHRAWFLTGAVALPAVDLVTTGPSLGAPDLAVYGVFLAGMVVLQLIVMSIGPTTLRYRVRFEQLIVETAVRTIRIPLEEVLAIEMLDGRLLRFRSGLSLKGYHVGTFRRPEGDTRVAASRLRGPGLLIAHWQHFGPVRRKSWLFISPEEPEATCLALRGLLGERLERLHLGQP